ncbi:uncharacterized protein [Ptychodera flava]|uniref:uncharacterized protein n=1 Tax=Ptychodera flava TaxID=63121 RepID=UPI00396A9E0E
MSSTKALMLWCPVLVVSGLVHMVSALPLTSRRRNTALVMAQSTCPDVFDDNGQIVTPIKMGYKCYVFQLNNINNITFSESADWCYNRNGSLVRFETAQEESYVINYINTNWMGYADPVWTGGKCFTAIGSGLCDTGTNWKWIEDDGTQGTSMSYLNWDIGEPNPRSANRDNNYCMVLNKNSTTGQWVWYDWNCDESLDFICEFELTAVSTTAIPYVTSTPGTTRQPTTQVAITVPGTTTVNARTSISPISSTQTSTETAPPATSLTTNTALTKTTHYQSTAVQSTTPRFTEMSTVVTDAMSSEELTMTSTMETRTKDVTEQSVATAQRQTSREINTISTERGSTRNGKHTPITATTALQPLTTETKTTKEKKQDNENTDLPYPLIGYVVGIIISSIAAVFLFSVSLKKRCAKRVSPADIDDECAASGYTSESTTIRENDEKADV